MTSWIAQIGAALCSASRWLAAASLGLTLCALLALPSGVLMMVIGLGAAQVYLAVRIEFDRTIFAAAAEAGFDGFDEALQASGLRRGPPVARSPESRVAGLAALVRWSGALLVAQFVLWIVFLWMPR